MSAHCKVSHPLLAMHLLRHPSKIGVRNRCGLLEIPPRLEIGQLHLQPRQMTRLPMRHPNLHWQQTEDLQT
ncbi:hypothetical protein M758_8G188600 [Ceratodon purpureus]|nr:hypothetical protein M758_8G188600 [Ceratodon purpureus]